MLFALPQFFQAVGGSDALGTGLRLLPVIGACWWTPGSAAGWSPGWARRPS